MEQSNAIPINKVGSTSVPNTLGGRGVTRYDTTTKGTKAKSGYSKSAKTGSVTINNNIYNPNPSAVAAQITKQATLGVTKGK
jgi:hypothetical protein